MDDVVSKILLFLRRYFLIALFISYNSYADNLTAALFYGPNPPLAQLQPFDIVIVTPSSTLTPSIITANQKQLFAYVSVGEVAKDSPYYKEINSTWTIAENKAWRSKVMDLNDSAWQNFILDKIIAPLEQQGYRNFFFDTLDSYQLAQLTPNEQQKQQAGLVKIIKNIKAKYPEAKIILNRGFEVIPAVHNDIYAVVAESLFFSWDQASQAYKEVSINDSNYLLEKLKMVQRYNIPVIVVDYLSPDKKIKAPEAAKRIMDLGMIPWITDKTLTSIYYNNSGIKILGRKILILYQGEKGSTIFNPEALNLALPLEYLGFIPEFREFDTSLPQNLREQGYIGIVSFSLTLTSKQQTYYYQWLLQQKQAGIPLVFMGSLGFDLKKQWLESFGLLTEDLAQKPQNIKINKINKALMGYEIAPQLNPLEYEPLSTNNASEVLLQLVTEKGQHEEAAAIMPWGGYVLDPYVTITLPNTQSRWVIDPFLFLQKALRLPTIPVPDVTTENGRRLMLVHVDGDGFATKVENDSSIYAAVNMKNEIFNRYKIPTTVSVITSEFDAKGLYANLYQKLIVIAQDIFKLPWIEVATHTYSHPFDWIKVATYPKSGKYNLPVPNYHYNPNIEVTTSVNFITAKLAPPNKKCKVMLWSGLANVDEKVLGLTYENNVVNYNGGNTNITHDDPSITNIAPLGRQVGKYYQVYAAIGNEEYFTHSWSGPFYGFQRVIETLQMTDTPRRLKPLDIYYHFYSAAKTASLDALKKVYEWSLQQNVMNVYVSDYVAKVLDFNTANSGINSKGGYYWYTGGKVREFRAPLSLGFPDLIHSNNIVGYNIYNNNYYLHAGSENKTIIYFSKEMPTVPYLKSANGSILDFQRSTNGFSFSLSGYLPLKFELANMKGCELLQQEKLVKAKIQQDDSYTYELEGIEAHGLSVRCN